MYPKTWEHLQLFSLSRWPAFTAPPVPVALPVRWHLSTCSTSTRWCSTSSGFRWRSSRFKGCIHVVLCCRTTMWYWESFPVWKCRSADANSAIYGQYWNLILLIVKRVLNRLLHSGFCYILLHPGWIVVADCWPASFSSPSLCTAALTRAHNWALHNRIISWHIEHIDWLSDSPPDNWSIVQTLDWLITWLGISQFPIWSALDC